MRLTKPDLLHGPNGSIARRSIGLLGLVLVGLNGCGGKAQEAAGGKPEPVADTAAAQMVGLGKGHVDKFMNYSQTAAMRNMLGGARAVFIAPDVGGGSLLVGVDSGSGFLLQRHGEDWSDPVFFTLTEDSAGEQLGIKESHVIVLLMTDMAVKNFVAGNMQVGGTGGITIGAYGMGISGAGGVDGGLELLIISTTQGFSLGGGVATIQPKINTALNAQAYGERVDPKEILAVPGGKYAPARSFRKDLTTMVLHAWDIPPGSPTISQALSGQ
jgi:lipid-binding SYLF domain-containing protein